MSESLRFLLLARHGEGYGDLRREAWRRGERVRSVIPPEKEAVTSRGARQSYRLGRYIEENFIKRYGLPGFDVCLVSPALRCIQSAGYLGLKGAVWQEDARLSERDRGLAAGLHPSEYQRLYPESYAKLQSDQLHARPPEGETIIEVARRVGDLVDELADSGATSALLMTSRDTIWGSQMKLDGLDEAEMAKVDTEAIKPAHLFGYMALNPYTERAEPALTWKLSHNPSEPELTTGWQVLPNAPGRQIEPSLPVRPATDNHRS